MARDGLSELEGCVLGAVARLGPCSAYAVRREFHQSLTTSWRASAGAIYPVLERLTKRGFILEEAVQGDARGTRMLSVSKAGRTALADWISDAAPWLGEATADPIRTRMQFMDLTSLPSREQITSWIARTELAMAQIEGATAKASSNDEEFRNPAHRGTWLQLEARKRWLNELRDGPPTSPD